MSTLVNPMHPGQFLYEGYMEPIKLTTTELAKDLGVSVSSVSRLISGKSDLSYTMAIRLSKVFVRTPEAWMNVQVAYGLAKAKAELDSK